jgi:hypothetical protein
MDTAAHEFVIHHPEVEDANGERKPGSVQSRLERLRPIGRNVDRETSCQVGTES